MGKANSTDINNRKQNYDRLVSMIISGTEKARAESDLFNLLQEPVRFLTLSYKAELYQKLNSNQEWEDWFIKCMYKLIKVETLRQYELGTDFLSFAKTITKRFFIDKKRKWNTRQKRLSTVSIDKFQRVERTITKNPVIESKIMKSAEFNPLQTLENNEKGIRVDIFIEKVLGKKLSRLVQLFFYSGKTDQEIANELGVSKPNAILKKHRLKNELQKLKEKNKWKRDMF